MEKKIAVLPGDGVGEEVMVEALKVLELINEHTEHQFNSVHALIGGAAFDETGEHFPEETKTLCRESDAILFGSVGGPVADLHLDKWNNCEANSLLGLRKEFGFNCNYRPVKVFPMLSEFCPLKDDLIQQGIDILFIRELLGDIYFGEKKRFVESGLRKATDIASYDEQQVRSVAMLGFKAAELRGGRLVSVDKANVLSTSKLWREVVEEVAKDFPSVSLEHMLVDNCAMQIIKNPAQFDVILCSNMFGDILSDAGAVLPGSLGLMASASMNELGFGMFEPPGGSAQDIAGKGIANPIGQILSLAMLLRFSFSLDGVANQIEEAVTKTLDQGLRTADIARESDKISSTVDMSEGICANLKSCFES